MTTKKLIAFVLAFAMVFCLMAVPGLAYDTGDANTVSNQRANLSIVYLGKTGQWDLPGSLTAQEIPAKMSMASNETVWIGVQLSNVSKIADLVGSDKKGTTDGGMFAYQFTFAYDSTLFTCPINGEDFMASDILGLLKEYSPAFTVNRVVRGAATPEKNGYMFDSSNLGIASPPSASDTSKEVMKVKNPEYYRMPVVLDTSVMTSGTTGSRMFHNNQSEAVAVNSSVSDAPVILAVIPLWLKSGVSWPESVTDPIVQLALDQTSFNMSFGYSGATDASWKTNQNGSSPEKNLKNYFNLVDISGNITDGTLELVPVPLPDLKGTVTISGTPTYGQTLTATTADGADGNVSTTGAKTYTWKVGGTAVANNNKATYDVKGGDIGKTITCEVSTANANGVITSDATAAVAKATLTLKQAGFTDALTGNFTITEGNAAAVKKGLSYSLNSTKADGLVNTTDKVSVTMDVTYPANSAVGNPELDASNFALTGNQAGYYQLATGTSLKIKGTVNAKVLDSIAVTTQPTFSKTQYEIGDTLGWTGMVVTATYNNSSTAPVASYTTTPASGDTISAADNGKALTVSYTEGGVTKTATTTTKISVNIPDVLNSINIKTQPTLTYNVGDKFDPRALVINAVYRDQGTVPVDYNAGTFTLKIGETVIDADTEMTAAMNGQQITVEYLEKSTKTNALKVTVPAVDSVTVTVTGGTFEKDYDNTVAITNPDGLSCTASGYEVEGTPKFEYASANVGENVEVKYVSGLSIKDHPEATVVITGLTGTIKAVAPTITLGNLAQTVGSVTPVSATTSPASSETGDKPIVEVKLVTTTVVPGDPCTNEDHANEEDHDEECGWTADTTSEDEAWVAWDEAVASLTQAGTYKVRAKIGDSPVNYVAGTMSAEADLVLSNRPSGGYVPVVPNHEAYIIGDDNGNFRPNDGMTRAEAAVIMARISDDFNENNAYTTRLSDVASHWASNWIAFASSKGIVNGRPDGTFDPNGSLTRAELAVMVANFAGIAPNNSAYAFADTTGHWAEGYIAALKAAGIVIGDGGNFRPDAAISRAEAVTMINRALDRTPDAAKVNTAVTASPFYDVNRSQWFFAQVIEASQTHKPADFHG